MCLSIWKRLDEMFPNPKFQKFNVFRCVPFVPFVWDQIDSEIDRKGCVILRVVLLYLIR